MENKELISKAITFALQHAGKTDISVSDVAKGAGFSLDYFNRIFLTHTGFTVMSYINYIRLKEAARLLRSTERNILDIALDVGYESHEGFIKAFKKQYQCTPSEYRNRTKTTLLSFGEFHDCSVSARFLHEHHDFTKIDTEFAIDELLEKDAKRYGRFCAEIKYMGLELVAPDGNYEKGMIAIGNFRNGDHYLELFTDDYLLLIDWLHRFPNVKTIRTSLAPELLSNFSFINIEESVYCGDILPCNLPASYNIRPLTAADISSLQAFTVHTPVNLQHLLEERYYNYETSLDYGVFVNDFLLAVAECGIDEIHGVKLSESCRIHFSKNHSSDLLYRDIFAYITNDLVNRGVLPFNDIQYGEYAQTHGNFTSLEMGYHLMGRKYELSSP